LLDLQGIDTAADRLMARRGALEVGEEVLASRRALASIEGELGDLRLAIDEAARAQGRLEGDVDGFQRKIEGEEKRLYDGTVANAKELESIQAEVTNLRGRKARVEDDLLEVMERREKLEGSLAQSDLAAVEARAGVAGLQGSSAAELEEIERQLAEKASARDALLAGIDDDLVELYDDLRRQKKGIGAAALVDGVCQGCHQQLSAVELERLKRADGVRRCDYCRRILVF
jgi:predicted  nucleic acid-binding Zn-ribbon protein